MVEKITLMDAYLIEHLRQANISDDEIVEAVLAMDASRFQNVNESFDFELLHELSNRIKVIVQSGYQVKFLTFNGLINLLRIKFNKEKNSDFYTDGFIIQQLKISDEAYTTLHQLVSSNWIVMEEVDGVKVKPKQ